MKLRLTVDIKYDLHGTNPRYVEELLGDAFRHILAHGLLTDDTPATVAEWEMRVEQVNGQNGELTVVHKCAKCGRKLQLVRPGKYQCPRC